MGAKGLNKSKVQYVFSELLRPHPLLCCPSPAQALSLPGQSLTSQGQWRAQVWLPYWSPLLHTTPHPIYTRRAKPLWLVERTPTELAPPSGAVFAEAPFQDGYDLTIGTSERGSDVASAQLPSFRWVQPRAGAGGWGVEWSKGPVWWGQSRTDNSYRMWAAFSVVLMSSQ